MATVSPAVRSFFHLRLGVAILSLVGFWVCLARVDGPHGGKGGHLEVSGGSDAGRAGGIHPEKYAPGIPGNGNAGPGDPAGPPPVVLPEPVVMIDAGHGGMDGGTVGNGLVEKDWTLKVGLALAEELRGRGHKVAMTREGDDMIPVLERPALVNAAPRIALLSVHFNAGSADASGVETWYSWPKKPEVMARLHDGNGVLVGAGADDGQLLAQAVQESVQGRTGARDRGIKNRVDLAMTSRTVCPAILIECGFLSNGAESRKIQDPGYRRKLVQGIADGYELWLERRRAVPVVVGGEAPEAMPVPGTEGTSATGDAEH